MSSRQKFLLELVTGVQHGQEHMLGNTSKSSTGTNEVSP